MANLDELVADAPMELVALGRLKGVYRNALVRLVKSGRIEHSVDAQVQPSAFDAYVAANGRPR
jgi:hypothetical protein